MEEVVKLVVEKTGLSEAHAKLAVETVLGFLKTKLPAPLAGQLDGLLGGSGGAAANPLGQAGDLVKGLGGLFK